MMSEAIGTLQRYLSNESNTVHFYGCEQNVKHFVKVLYDGISCDYEAPDMYIQHEDEIWIIEHFEFDCYKRTRKGSSCRIEQSRIEREIETLIPTEEGTTYHGTINATSSYDDYINNVKTYFESHYKKIAKYKQHLIDDKIADENTRFYVMFLIDDISPLGTFYVDKKAGFTVIELAHSKEFLDIMKESPDIDYVFTTAYCSNEKFMWFIDREQLSEYYQNAIDYSAGRFLDFKPHIVGGKIVIPDCKFHKEVSF